jgi:phospholipase C
VFRAKQILDGVEQDVPLDHTSIIKTVTNRWGLGHLTERDKAAFDISQVLEREEPRKDCPILDPHHPVETFTSYLPLNGLQHGMITAMASYCETPLPKLSNVTEAIPFLEKLAKKIGL